MNETAIRPMEIEWSNRRTLSCSAEEYEVAGASGKARKIYVALSFIPGVPLSLSLTPGQGFNAFGVKTRSLTRPTD